MPRLLNSQVFSSATLLAGVNLVKTEAGMDDLAGLTTEDLDGLGMDELQAHLKALEACTMMFDI